MKELQIMFLAGSINNGTYTIDLVITALSSPDSVDKAVENLANGYGAMSVFLPIYGRLMKRDRQTMQSSRVVFSTFWSDGSSDARRYGCRD